MTYKQALMRQGDVHWYGWFPTKGLKVGAVLGGATVVEVYHGPTLIRCKRCGKLNSSDVIRCIDCKENR